MLVLKTWAGNRTTDEFGDESRNGNSAVATATYHSVEECIFVNTSIPLT